MFYNKYINNLISVTMCFVFNTYEIPFRVNKLSSNYKTK